MTSASDTAPPADAALRHAPSPWLRLALEAGPLAVFFIANRIGGIFAGTAALMAAMPVALLLSYRLERRIPLMPLVTAAFVLVFGGLTLLLDDELFIKLKPTIVNLIFAGALFVGLAFGRSLIRVLMGPMLSLSDAGWRILTWRWAFFFVVLAGLNEVVWRNFSTDTWVDFKVFGIMPLTLLWGMAQVPLILKHQIPEPAAQPAAPADG